MPRGIVPFIEVCNFEPKHWLFIMIFVISMLFFLFVLNIKITELAMKFVCLMDKSKEIGWWMCLIHRVSTSQPVFIFPAQTVHHTWLLRRLSAATCFLARLSVWFCFMLRFTRKQIKWTVSAGSNFFVDGSLGTQAIDILSIKTPKKHTEASRLQFTFFKHQCIKR